MISKSPQRHTFQVECHVERAKEAGEEPNDSYVEMWERIREEEAKRELDPEWQKNNLEYDLRSTDWILEKVRSSETYAQNLYAAMCNMQFVRKEIVPYLRQGDQDLWSCSWRHSGGIIADMRQEGDYIDWYCSGIRGGDFDDAVDVPYEQKKFVPEGTVTEEIEQDLFKLGWIPVPWREDE